MVDRQRTARATPSRLGVPTRPTSASRKWGSLFSSHRSNSGTPMLGEQDIERALANGELDVHYQLVLTGDGQPAGAEALLRWQRPGVGLLGAGAFIGVIESTELFRQVSDLVVSELVAALPLLRSTLDAPLPYLSFNAPARQLQDQMFASRIAAFLHAEGAVAHGLVVELIDPAEVTDWRAVRNSVQELQRLDISLAVEDTGAEPGDMIYRDRATAPIVKLDRTLVAESHRWAREREVIEATVELCKADGTTVIAQGVEHEDTLEFLADLGVDYLQGFHIARPEPLADLLDRVG